MSIQISLEEGKNRVCMFGGACYDLLLIWPSLIRAPGSVL